MSMTAAHAEHDDPSFFDTVESLPGFDAVLAGTLPRPRPLDRPWSPPKFQRQSSGNSPTLTSSSYPIVRSSDAVQATGPESYRGSSSGASPPNFASPSQPTLPSLQHTSNSKNPPRSEVASSLERKQPHSSVALYYPSERELEGTDHNVALQQSNHHAHQEQASSETCSLKQLRSEIASPVVDMNAEMHAASADSNGISATDQNIQVQNGAPPSSASNMSAQDSAESVDVRSDHPASDTPNPVPLYIPRKYNLVHDIVYADRAPDADISIVKIASEVIAGVKHGADLTNINLPASVLDPVSTLEKGMKSMQRGELIQAICQSTEPLDRFLAVLRFYFSGLSKEKFGKKPYNPILGEVFRSCFKHSNDGGYTILVAEQVSHHPPITAVHLCNDRLGFKMNSYTAPEPRFWGNSVEVRLKGMSRITLENWENEEYELTRPCIHMSGFLAGRHRLEYVGKTLISCEKTGYYAEVEFKGKGLMGRGELNGVSARVMEQASKSTLFTITGTWDGVLTATDVRTGEKSTLYDYEAVVAEHSMIPVLPPVDDREETFSSKVWADCSEAIWKGDSVAANNAKRQVEDYQRELRKGRASKGIPWSHMYFEARTDGKQGYVLREGLRRMLGPEMELSGSDQAKMEEMLEALSRREENNDSDHRILKLGRHKKL